VDKISVIGLGKLGQGLAACFAARGFRTLGIDIDPKVVDAINAGTPSVVEPELPEYVRAAGDRLRASLDSNEAIRTTDASCILLPTPSDSGGTFSNRFVNAALVSLAQALRQSNKPYHLFMINSTVMPGSTQKGFIPLIEKISGRLLNEGFGVCYCPETVALGTVIRNFLRPDHVIIGESDDCAGRQAASIYTRLCENAPRVFRMSIINAEIAKLSLNCYLTLKISFVNSLANLCDLLPGADVDQITRAIGADHRISQHFLRGGLSYGGTCFPRDTKAFVALAEKHGLEPHLIRAAEEVNEFQHQRLAELVLQHLEPNGCRAVSILGLAFKPNTPVIEGSPAIRLIDTLLRHGAEVTVYDPLASEEARGMFGEKIRYASSARACTSFGHVCVVTTPADEFRELDESAVAKHPMTIIDCWRILDPAKFGLQTRYVAWGVSPSESEGQCAPVKAAAAAWASSK
jgi:UDPglucose 6-dehydrogenase